MSKLKNPRDFSKVRIGQRLALVMETGTIYLVKVIENDQSHTVTQIGVKLEDGNEYYLSANGISCIGLKDTIYYLSDPEFKKICKESGFNLKNS